MSQKQHQVLNKNASKIRIGNTSFEIENGQLTIRDGAYYQLFTAQESLKIFNLLFDQKSMIIPMAKLEQMQQERERRKSQAHPKPKMIQVNGVWVETVELETLQKEQEAD